jgi:hypothetical protein
MDMKTLSKGYNPMKKLMMLTAAALVISAPAAFAEPDGKPHHKGDMLEKIDTDKDGAVSKAEFLAFHEERFKEIDANGDGKISKEEGEAKKAEWKAKRKEMMKGEAPAEAPAEAPVEAPAETPPAEAPAQ